MGSSQRLTEAFQRQFGWVSVLVVNPKGRTKAERRQAVVFFVLHVSFALMLAAHVITVVASWCLAFVLQAVDMALGLLYLSYVRDYREKRQDAMEVERLGNPLVVAQVSVRAFAVVHAMIMGSTTMLLLSLVEVAYDVYVARERSLLLDATTLWREAAWRDRDAVIRCVYQIVMVLCSIFHFLLSMIFS